MPHSVLVYIKSQLQNRRRRLDSAIGELSDAPDLTGLLGEVDAALERIESGTYGICETCHDPIEDDRLMADFLIRVCLDHLDPHQQRSLEQDLELASRIQMALLPPRDVSADGLEIAYRYQPHGPVSGDYCDLVPGEEAGQPLVFIMGDVSGKGIAASMLMSHLHALFHSLRHFERAIEHLMARANRQFCESTLSSHFATMVLGELHPDGTVRFCNAGHCPPVIVHGTTIDTIHATGLPIGMFCSTEYRVTETRIAPGETVFLYTDGLTESNNGEEEYGEDRVMALADSHRHLSPEDLIDAYVGDVSAFLSGRPGSDDFTLMAIRRAS